MPQVRVHNVSISLDGFGTGDGLTLDAPFGHAGERLHGWMIATRFWRAMVGEPGGGTGVDHAFAERHELGIGAEIMGRGKFGPPKGGPWTGLGTDEEWRGWWGPNPVASIHSWSRCPAWPNGVSRACPSPVAKPSSEIETLWTRTCGIAPPAREVVATCNRCPGS